MGRIVTICTDLILIEMLETLITYNTTARNRRAKKDAWHRHTLLLGVLNKFGEEGILQ